MLYRLAKTVWNFMKLFAEKEREHVSYFYTWNRFYIESWGMLLRGCPSFYVWQHGQYI